MESKKGKLNNRRGNYFWHRRINSEGIMSMEEGDDIMKEAREVITTEQLLYRKRKEEIEKAYNEYEEIINAKDMPLECKEILLCPGRDIVNLVSKLDNAQRN